MTRGLQMKIKYSELKQVIKEELVSPTLMNQDTKLDVAGDLDALASKFESAAFNVLLRQGSDNYDPSSREYDDAAYQRAKTEAQTAAKQLRTKVVAALKEVWSSVQSGQAPDKSGVYKKPAMDKKVA